MSKLQDKIISEKPLIPCMIDYCELCGRKMKRTRRKYNKTNVCDDCIKKQYY